MPGTLPGQAVPHQFVAHNCAVATRLKVHHEHTKSWVGGDIAGESTPTHSDRYNQRFNFDATFLEDHQLLKTNLGSQLHYSSEDELSTELSEVWEMTTPGGTFA